MLNISLVTHKKSYSVWRASLVLVIRWLSMFELVGDDFRHWKFLIQDVLKVWQDGDHMCCLVSTLRNRSSSTNYGGLLG
jgi:hypothetical protein